MKHIKFLKNLNTDLNEGGALDDVYEACRTLDMAGAVIAALRVLHDTGNLPEIENKQKNEDLASLYRNKGLLYFHKRKLCRRALEWYNRALLRAPDGSRNLMLAYYNRSELSFYVGAYAESLKDIETCIQFQCEKELAVFFRTTGLLEKLTTMKEKCEEKILNNEDKVVVHKNSFSEQFFKIKGQIHPEIPCLSADIDIVHESGKMKAVATKDIPVGTVLLVETAYATCSTQEKSLVTCYYCQKMAFHLTPCDNCCYALFCGKKCKELCLNEYHLIECQIMDLLQEIDNGGRFRLAIKTVLKLKTQCEQWSTLIKESENIGANRLKNSSLKELYDVNNYSSMLSFNSDRHFIYGSLYNSSFVYALVIYYLQKISGFFPVKQKDCLQAKKCLAKLFMTLELMWPSVTQIYNNAADPLVNNGSPFNKDVPADLPYHYGLLSFTSKLRHDCEPNVFLVGLDNQVCMFAIQPIKDMSELKVSHNGHWLLRSNMEHAWLMKLFHNTLIVCTCRVCKEGWNNKNLMKTDLSKFQKSTCRQWSVMNKDPLNAPIFEETCKTLTVLNKRMETSAYYNVFKYFVFILRCHQLIATQNCWLSY
ncbi:uncharacterized protein isoform X1 [Choristoneura fumiferana]|uniref:uncharacterized protein isoform X1 n=1 Tax=Choristoneura fumiferana TaxID=7141 RepID=UPI003D15C7B7